MKAVALIVGLALLAFLALGVYQAGRNEIPPPPVDTNIVAKHGGCGFGERIATRSWTACYARMVANADQTIVDLYGVRDGIIFSKGKPYYRVTADHLAVNTINKNFTATGPLHMETVSEQPSRRFDTDAAMWNDADQKLTLPHKTKLVTGEDPPMLIGSLSIDVKTGDVDVRDVAGSIRFK